MRVACPACSAVFSLDMLIANEAARDAIITSLSLPAPLGKLLIQYVALFRPTQKLIPFDRLAVLLTGLLEPITAGRVEVQNRIWPAPHASWKAALEEVLRHRDEGKLNLPLSSHAYLFKVVANLANKAEARTEQKAEADKLYANRIGVMPDLAEKPGLHQIANPPAPAVRSVMPSNIAEQLKAHAKTFSQHRPQESTDATTERDD